MKIIDLNTNTEIKNIPFQTSIAVGNFDGVHKGHRALFECVKKTAGVLGTKSAVWSFCDFSPKNRGRCITLPDERCELIAECGIDYLILYEFDSVKDLPCEEFLSEILIKECRAEAVVCGFNFRFGKGAQGDCETLKKIMEKKGKKAFVMPPYEIDGVTVSSSLIRGLITDGKPELIPKYLGRPFSVFLPVVHGRHLGRTIDSPTINQNFPPEHIVPRYGVYACCIIIDGIRYGGVSNVGVRPSVCEGENVSVNCETHILNYSGDLYDREIRVEFLHFIRPERKFPSIDELKKAISADKITAKGLLGI